MCPSLVFYLWMLGRCTGAQTHRIIAPGTLYQPEKLQFHSLLQYKVILTQVNSTYIPLTGPQQTAGHD